MNLELGHFEHAPEEYPTARSKQKPRKRKHSWDDGPIVHYDYTRIFEASNPVLVQEGTIPVPVKTHRQKSASKSSNIQVMKQFHKC